MACLYTDGWSLDGDCLDGIGSVKTFFFGNFSGATVWSADADGILTGVTNGPIFYTVEQRSEQGAMTFDGVTDPVIGNTVFTHKAEVTLSQYQASARSLSLIMHQTRSAIIAQAVEGRYFLLGQENGCYGVNSNGGLGKAYTDQNGVTISFEGRGNLSAPREISATLISTLTIV